MIVSCIQSPRSQSAPIAARSSSSSSPSFPLRNLITSASRIRRPWQTKPCMLHRNRGMDSSRHAPGGGSCARDSSFLIRSCRTRHFVPSNISYVCPGPVVANDPSFISYEKLAQTKVVFPHLLRKVSLLPPQREGREQQLPRRHLLLAVLPRILR